MEPEGGIPHVMTTLVGSALSILNIHTPTSSFAVVHSLTQDTLDRLFDTLSRKAHTDYHGARVGPGWLKYEFNGDIWNLDDDSDYTIFAWRQQQRGGEGATADGGPTLHLHDPAQPLSASTSTAYRNAAYYLFRPLSPTQPLSSHINGKKSHSGSPAPSSRSSRHTGHTRADERGMDGVPAFKQVFERFHGENGVRTVMGSIGPVQNVRMLLKSGYRHVYISRKFAAKHGFIPRDAAPGRYGYGGLVNIGVWPITLTSSSSSTLLSPSSPDTPSSSQSRPPVSPAYKKRPADIGVNAKTSTSNHVPHAGPGPKPTTTHLPVYLSEEPHFDVVLGRSFFDRRQVRTSAADPTDVVCLDTGERIECELVILKDGRGQIVIVT